MARRGKARRGVARHGHFFKGGTLNHQTYSQLPGINWSTLRAAAKSAAHYQHRLSHPVEETPAMRFGRAVHTAVFEPDRFPLEYVVYQGGRRAGNEWEAFAEIHAAQTIIKAEEYETALAIRDAVRTHPVARKLLRSGKAEQTITWTDEETGLACKGRLDWLGRKAALDLKTTGDIEARTFGRLAAKMLYHCQLAFYDAGLRANKLQRSWKIIAVEAEPPHDVAVFDVDEDALYAGEEQVREMLRLVADCRKTKRWPGRYPTEQKLELPGWVYSEAMDEELVLMGLKPAV